MTNILYTQHTNSSNEARDTPLTKEEQLLGYTAQQRQRLKALHILGLTEEVFERCRAIMLSSLGPSAFGGDDEEKAQWAAKAAEKDWWTPADMPRRQPVGGAHGLLRMKSFYQNSG